MKKIFSVFLSVIMIITISAASLSAADVKQYDSLDIQNDIKEKLDSYDDHIFGDEYIRIYNVSLIAAFTEGQSIEEVISGKYMSEEMYAVRRAGFYVRKLVIRDDRVSAIYAGMFKGEGEFIDLAIKGNKAVDEVCPGAKVQNVYYLGGGSREDTVAIYYVTNKGDYVLFKDNLMSEKTYFMTLDEFYNFAEDTHAYYKSIAGTFGGPVNISEINDISEYEYSVPNVWISDIITASVIAVIVCGAIIYLINYKKRKRLQKEIN